MEPDIRFFQAAATVIPTLLIAVVLTAKTFDPGDYPTSDAVKEELPRAKAEERAERLRYAFLAWWMRTTVLALMFAALAAAVVLAERAALVALELNEPTEARMRMVTTGLIAELAVLLISAAKPLTGAVARHATQPYQRALGMLIGLSIPLAVVVTLRWPI